MAPPTPLLLSFVALLAAGGITQARAAIGLPIPPIPPNLARTPQPAAPQAAPTAPATDLHKGTVTGLPLPRFVSLRSDQVNLRSGPGMQYPIEWLYQRRGLPVQVEREFDNWRLVVTPDGAKGWVHEATITGERTFLVTDGQHAIRAAASDTAAPVAKLDPGVVGRILRCAAGADWCRVQVRSYRGWLPRRDFWGTTPGEDVRQP